jgi:hypothetical protein
MENMLNYDFMKYSHSKAMAVFYKIVKLVKNGVLNKKKRL